MKFVPPDTYLKDYRKRRSAFLKELIASTPNVSVRGVRFGGACKGERRRADTNTDTTGTSNTGCSASAAA